MLGYPEVVVSLILLLRPPFSLIEFPRVAAFPLFEMVITLHQPSSQLTQIRRLKTPYFLEQLSPSTLSAPLLHNHLVSSSSSSNSPSHFSLFPSCLQTIADNPTPTNPQGPIPKETIIVPVTTVHLLPTRTRTTTPTATEVITTLIRMGVRIIMMAREVRFILPPGAGNRLVRRGVRRLHRKM